MPQDALTIVLSDQRLQFVVADHLGQAHLLKEYTDESCVKSTDLLNAVFSEDVDIRKAYAKAHLVLKSPVALLEPVGRKEEVAADLSKYMIPDVEGIRRLSDRIDSNGIKVVYPFKESAISFVHQMFPNLAIYHHHTILIQHFASLSQNLSGQGVYVQIDRDCLSIFYYKNSKLQYGNQFQTSSEEDRIYYIMLIYKQFDLDPISVLLSISIGSEVGHKFVSNIRLYIQHIEILEFVPTGLPSTPVFQDSNVFKQFYFPLSAMSVLN